jgi:hypothetical protein
MQTASQGAEVLWHGLLKRDVEFRYNFPSFNVRQNTICAYPIMGSSVSSNS